MKIAIVGFGREGKALLKFLKKKYSKGAEFWILDKNQKIVVPKNTKKQTGSGYLKNLTQFNCIYRSPGVPYNLPEFIKARAKGVVFSSATALFFESAHKVGAKIIGITGSKGKSTTATAIYMFLRKAKRRTFLVGNIGKPALEIIPELSKNVFAVMELSSFQLQDMEMSPQIAVVTDIFPEHQDAHGSLREYYGAKANIARHQKKPDVVFFFPKNSKSKWIASQSQGRKIPVHPEKFITFKKEELIVQGQHNFKNLVMAATVAHHLGVSLKIVASVAKNFRGLEHRLEFIRKINNVVFYNDSASTNPQATIAALLAFPDSQKILIAGGADKNLDYVPLAKVTVRDKKLQAIILFGKNKNKIKKTFAKIKNSKFKIKQVRNLKEAVMLAYKIAKKNVVHNSKFKIIFSPASTSFDMFQNYADRGNQFKKLIRSL